VILALINVANRYMLADRFEDALRTANQAIEIANATNWPTQAGAARIILALVYRAEGELDQALLAIRESVRMLQPPEGETSTGRLQPYGLALLRQAQILGEPQAISLMRRDEAVDCLRRVLAIAEQFARHDPTDFQSQYRVFMAETKLAAILRDTQPARAVEMYDDALRRLSAIHENAGTLRNETATLAASTYPLLSLSRGAEARKRLDSAFARLTQLKQYPAQQIELGSPAHETLQALAEYEAYRGNRARAAELYDELLRLVLAGHPNPEISLDHAVKLSNIYGAAASSHRRAGHPEPAADLEMRRLDLWRRWAEKVPNNAFVLRQFEAARLRQRPT
jgi:hypothetical protein